MPFRSCPAQVAVAVAAPTRRACRWPSNTLPKTRPSTASCSCAGSFQRRRTPDADNRHTARVAGQPIRKRGYARSSGTRTHPATGTWPSTAGSLPLWRTALGTRAGSWGTSACARPHTTSCGLLRQPDKHKRAREFKVLLLLAIRAESDPASPHRDDPGSLLQTTSGPPAAGRKRRYRKLRTGETPYDIRSRPGCRPR